MTELDYTNQPVIVISWKDLPEQGDLEQARQLFITAMQQIQTELSSGGYIAGYQRTKEGYSVLIIRKFNSFFYGDAQDFGWYGGWSWGS